MSLLRTELWPNGNIYTEVYYYTCNRCGKEVCESWPHWDAEILDYHLCWDCAFIEGRIDEKEYLLTYRNDEKEHATIIEGKIIRWRGKIPPWEKDDRNLPEYRRWREAVFKRDNYTCQDCGVRGRELNAHHKKSWAQHKELRFDTNNGITLCLECHKKVHKKKVG